ncbi:hypothetical protein PRIPAC_95659 [Pristionchus pacificus]|uniref:Uncharacterized protein n=1 Tax=Pristionchus pacificus TaxID=54126 RepID=A0A2A6D2L9_PRIPA|nr:hypothetical protein PRIPAC_95659 [Pristionchus pacificus]|eukprot:PDM84557.1 hypothetical protein PRIPAC_33580 [Pristionchus pacificus]
MTPLFWDLCLPCKSIQPPLPRLQPTVLAPLSSISPSISINSSFPSPSVSPKSLFSDTKNIELFYSNARSIRRKTPLLYFVKSLGYNLILLTETWLTNDDSDAYLMGSADDYVVFRKDRTITPEKSRGGGVAILVSPLLHPILIDTFSSDGIETLVIDIHPSIPILSTRICIYHLADWESINNCMSAHDWTLALSSLDADNAFSYFSEFANSVLDTFVPKTTSAPFSRYPKHLRILYGKSQRASIAAPNSVRTIHLVKRFERSLREHSVRIETRVVDSKNPKAFYALCKSRLKSCNSAPPGIVDLDGTHLLSNTDKAHAFSRYFASVSTSPLHGPLTHPTPSPYFTNGIPLTVSPFMKDLGVIMHPSFKFTDHVSKMTSKARAKVNLMFKCFFSSDPNLYSRAFTTFIRPLLEYGSVIWFPHTVTLANQIEAVQRNFSLRLFTRCRIPYSLYPDRINLLSLQTLEHRRFISDLLFLHKSIHGFYSYDHSNLFKLSPLTRSLRRAHSLRIALPFVPPTSHSSFVTRVIDQWNVLSDEYAISSPFNFRSHLLSLPSISFSSDSLLRL